MIPRNFIPLFPLGRVVATQGAVALGADFRPYLFCHERGEWGTLLSKSDISANDQALADGDRILSYFQTLDGSRFYIITEADRSLTTILLPEEY
jgi:hypothetical protein